MIVAQSAAPDEIPTEIPPVFAENGNGLEIVKRNGEEKSFYFVMNFKDEDLKIPEEFAGKMDLLSGNAVEKGEMLPKFGVKILVE